MPEETTEAVVPTEPATRTATTSTTTAPEEVAGGELTLSMRAAAPRNLRPIVGGPSSTTPCSDDPEASEHCAPMPPSVSSEETVTTGHAPDLPSTNQSLAGLEPSCRKIHPITTSQPSSVAPQQPQSEMPGPLYPAYFQGRPPSPYTMSFSAGSSTRHPGSESESGSQHRGRDDSRQQYSSCCCASGVFAYYFHWCAYGPSGRTEHMMGLICCVVVVCIIAVVVLILSLVSHTTG